MASPSDQQKAAAAASVAALVVAQGKAYKQIEDKLVESVRKIMGRLFNRWYFQDEVDDAVDDLVEVVRAAQEAVADTTREYMDAINEAMGVRTIPSRVREPVKLPDRLRDVDPRTEWNRPARAARVGRLLGADEFEANEKAMQRAEQQARMDALLAAQEAERQRWNVSDDIIGYRRIIHPELGSGGPPCGLCVAAATRIYSKIKKRSLHGGCRCTVLPVLRDGSGIIDDPGFDLNRDDLDRLYAEAGGTGAEDLRSITVEVLDHGELGPILVDKRYANRKRSKPVGADKGALDSGKLDPQRLYDIQKKIVDDFDKKVKQGKTPQFDIDYHRRQLERLAKELGIDLPNAA